MAQTRRSKVKFPKLDQAVLFVKDLHKTINDYWNILGIGPWNIYTWEAPLVYDLKYHDKPTKARERLALAQLGKIELEVIEHIAGDSFYEDYIRKHGEGIHQLDFKVDDVDEVVRMLTKESFPCLQSGRWGDNGAYAIMDTNPLHVLWEPYRKPDNIGVKLARYPSKAQKSPAKVKVTEINAICFAVKDIQKVAEDYWNIFGIGPWEVYEWGAPLVHDFKYHGRPAQSREKVAIAKVKDIFLELYQPVDGDSCYQDFLKEHGEGVHHLSFAVDDVDEVVQILTKEGFPCLQSGRWGNNGAFALIDVKPLHTIWEPYRMPNDIEYPKEA